MTACQMGEEIPNPASHEKSLCPSRTKKKHHVHMGTGRETAPASTFFLSCFCNVRMNSVTKNSIVIATWIVVSMLRCFRVGCRISVRGLKGFLSYAHSLLLSSSFPLFSLSVCVYPLVPIIIHYFWLLARCKVLNTTILPSHSSIQRHKP